MARQPELRKKKIGTTTYWFTKAGGKTSFGNVDAVTFGGPPGVPWTHWKSRG